ALRFGVPGATTATAAVSVLAIWGTARGRGPFVHERLAVSLTYLQVFMAVAAATALVLAAAVSERARAIRARDEFLAIVTHDLKNPLSAVQMTTAHILRLLGGEEASSKVGRSVETIQRSADRMQSLIGDLVDL